jgi:hydroxyacylglutathione hydrolase
MEVHLNNILLQFKQIPAFTDNYLWVLIQHQQAWVVDPGDADPIIEFFEQQHLSLKGILITHHHQDHIGGVIKLQDWSRRNGQKDFKTLGPLHSQISMIDQVLQHGDEVELYPDVRVRVIAVPGHTLSHIAYFLPIGPYNPIPRLYCGDTLFAAGCGRLFEGSPEQMYQSLGHFKELPDETLVCCAHEYTLSNLKFACFLEPHNGDLLEWTQQAQQLRALHQPTVPTSIGLEKKVNPFMRCDLASLMKSAQQYSDPTISTPIEVLAAIRKMKDSFA